LTDTFIPIGRAAAKTLQAVFKVRGFDAEPPEFKPHVGCHDKCFDITGWRYPHHLILTDRESGAEFLLRTHPRIRKKLVSFMISVKRQQPIGLVARVRVTHNDARVPFFDWTFERQP
jgi:hypothetical protein